MAIPAQACDPSTLFFLFCYFISGASFGIICHRSVAKCQAKDSCRQADKKRESSVQRPGPKAASTGDRANRSSWKAPRSTRTGYLIASRLFFVTCASNFFWSHAPWSALAAVGRGASVGKTMSLVRTSDRLYRAKVKQNGLRSGTRRCSQRVRLATL